MQSLLNIGSIIALSISTLYLINKYSQGCKYEGKTRLDGKVVVITGANTGIGRETALDFVKRGGRVYLACRSKSRGMEAVQYILNETQASQSNVIYMHLDLASLESVRYFSQEFHKRERSLNLLINNAGMMPFYREPRLTQDGIEETFQINHLGHFLLTKLLKDLLIKGSEKGSTKSRVINLSSVGHSWGPKFNANQVHSTAPRSGMDRYAPTKHANVLFTLELARRWKEHGIMTYSVHPGVVVTEIGRDIPAPLQFLLTPVRLFLKSTRQGAQTTIHCALSPGIERYNGLYFSDCKNLELDPEFSDSKEAKNLWELSEKLIL